MPAERPAPPERVDTADPQQVLRDARAKFVAAFPTELGRPDDLVAQSARRAPAAELRQFVHRIAGFAGTVGFPTVRAQAGDAIEDDPDQADVIASHLRAGGHRPVLVPSGAAASALLAELRRRDTRGWYDATHLLAVMPGLTAAEAKALIEGVLARLAQARAAGQPAAITGNRPLSVRRRRTIVVGEDDPEVVRIVDAQLRHEGFEIVIAFDGEQALDKVIAKKPDLLLLDLVMPKRSGFDVLAAVQRLEHRPRVVVLSARAREEDARRAFDLGADDYLFKPFSPQELRARISRLLR